MLVLLTSCDALWESAITDHNVTSCATAQPLCMPGYVCNFTSGQCVSENPAGWTVATTDQTSPYMLYSCPQQPMTVMAGVNVPAPTITLTAPMSLANATVQINQNPIMATTAPGMSDNQLVVTPPPDLQPGPVSLIVTAGTTQVSLSAPFEYSISVPYATTLIGPSKTVSVSTMYPAVQKLELFRPAMNTPPALAVLGASANPPPSGMTNLFLFVDNTMGFRRLPTLPASPASMTSVSSLNFALVPNPVTADPTSTVARAVLTAVLDVSGASSLDVFDQQPNSPRELMNAHPLAGSAVAGQLVATGCFQQPCTQAQAVTFIGQSTTSSISVLYYQNLSGLNPPTTLPSLTIAGAIDVQPVTVATADLNGDQLTDAVLVARVTAKGMVQVPQAFVLLGGAMTWQPLSFTFTTTISPSVALDDLDGDGKPDVVLSSSAGIAIFFNQTMPSATSVTLSSSPANLGTTGLKNLAIGEYSGDHKKAIVYTADGAIHLVQNHAGTLTDTPIYKTATAMGDAITLVDFALDTRPDAIVSHPTLGQVFFLENSCNPAPPAG